MNIRFAEQTDSEKLLKIYEMYIDTPITFEYRLPSQNAFKDRIKQIKNEYPYLLYEENGKIAGYAYAHRQGSREAYQWNAELSIYIDKEYAARGIGKKLYTALTELLRRQGIKTLYAVITLPNEKSEGFHKNMGFRCVGIHHNAGYKCGRWHDVGHFEKEIAPYCENPSRFMPVSVLSGEEIKDILQSVIREQQ